MRRKSISVMVTVLALGLTPMTVCAQENQIVNPEFDDGTDGWGRYGTTGFTWNVVEGVGLSGMNAALIDVTDAAATASIGIAQSGLILEPGKTYPIGFTAKAAQNRQMEVLLQTNLNNTTWPTQLSQLVDLTPVAETYVLEYTHTGDTLGDDPTETVTLYLMLKGQWWPMTGDDLNVKVWIDRVYFGAEPPLPRRDLATYPDPSDESTDVWREADLGWTPGAFAQTHDVYLGTVFDDVNDASRADAKDVLASQAQSGTAYDPGRLEYGTTYYWRVDEVNGPPDNAIAEGNVWSFTTEPLAYPVENITVTSNAASSDNELPVNTMNGSGLDANDLHSTLTNTMWLGNPVGADAVYIQYEFDRVYKLHEMWVWNYNAEFEMLLGFGLKDVTVEYSTDGSNWSALGDVEFAQATARSDYAHNTTVDFQGIAARYVRLTANSAWGVLGQFGLSEVRFLYLPAQARLPQPADGVTEVAVDAALTWRPGREAASHDVYLGTDAAALDLADSVTDAAYLPSDLVFGSQYYWRIDEVNDAEAIGLWEGDLWTFATQEFALIDGFETYDDDENPIFDTWLDGFVNDTGSTVGYFETPFAEISIVHGGAQSMPLEYNNAQAPFYSEASRTFETTQDWTIGGADSLRVHVHGRLENTADSLYVGVEDAAGNVAVVTHPDPDVLLIDSWQAWTIPLSELAAGGANLAGVETVIIGIGSRDNPAAGGTGLVFIDDLEFGVPLASDIAAQ